MEWNYYLSNIVEIQFIFDTGLHRMLTLSQKQSDQSNQVWGQPQPETVDNYNVEVYNKTNEWVNIIKVEGNYQRRNTHNITNIVNELNISFNKLRVNVTKDDGYDNTRIVEIRIYDKNGVQPFVQKI